MKITVRIDPKPHALIKRAAKAEKRSLNQYIIMAAEEAAKATLAMGRPNVFAPGGTVQEKSA